MPKGGDPLCPLGFAPHAVRPTRCKRCFRDLSDHKDAEAKKEETAPRKRDSLTGEKRWSKGDIKVDDVKLPSSSSKKDESQKKGDDENGGVSASATVVLRRRRPADPDDPEQDDTELSVRPRIRARPGSSGEDRSPSPPLQRKNSITEASDLREETNQEREKKRSRRIVQILSAQEIRPMELPPTTSDEDTSADVAFILQVKKTSHRLRGDADDEEDEMSLCPTETTDTTLTGGESLEDLQLQIQTLRNQLDATEDRCNILEQEKKDLQEFQVRSKEMELKIRDLEKTSKETLKLRAKIHELEVANEDLRDENKVVKLELKEIQDEVERRLPQADVQNTIDELRGKLAAAETLCEELMDENEDIKREIRDLEDEIEEMQDNFREDQADEYSILRKELEQTAKNCRILQFKLRKAEKKCDSLETDKSQFEDQLKVVVKGGHLDLTQMEKLKQMELELSTARDVSVKMHSEMETLQQRLKSLQEERESRKKTANENGEATKGKDVPGRPKDAYSDTDQSQLVRDLYDTIERENDLKEQLKYTEEEAENLRKKLTFLEQENETLVLQLKKMASKDGKRGKDGRRPPSRESSRDDDSGISDDTEELSPSELRLQLELFEQEADVLRRKVTELDGLNVGLHKEVKELQDKLAEKPKMQLPSAPSDPKQAPLFYEQKVKVLESEAKELRMKLIEKEREVERLNNDLLLKQRKGSRGTMTRSRSLDSDAQVDLKKQLHYMEQEATMLRQKSTDLETENDKLIADNRKLQIRAGTKPLTPTGEVNAENLVLKSKLSKLEKQLVEAKESKARLEEATRPASPGGLSPGSSSPIPPNPALQEEIESLRSKVEELTKQNERLSEQIKGQKDSSNLQIKKRKKILDSAPKSEFKKALEELELELNQVCTSVKEKEKQNETMSKELTEQKKAIESLKEEQQKQRKHVDQLNEKNATLTKSLQDEKDRANKINQTLQALEREKEKLASSSSDKVEIRRLKEQVESLKKDLKESELKSKKVTDTVSFDDLRKVEQDKHRLQKEIQDYQNKLSSTEKRLSDLEQGNREAEKIQRKLRNEIEDLNQELDRERAKLKKTDSRQNEVAMSWLKERDELKKQMSDLQKKNESITEEMMEKEKKSKQQEEKATEESRKRESVQNNLKLKEEEVKHVKENNNKLKTKLRELEDKFSKVDRNMLDLTDKWKKLDALYKREKEEWSVKQAELEAQIKDEVKKRDKMDRESEAMLRDRDEESIRLKDRIRKLEASGKKEGGGGGSSFITSVESDVSEFSSKLKDLQEKLSQEKKEYEELTTKYEILEEEHVVTKSKLVAEKEQIQAALSHAKKEVSKIEEELRTAKDATHMRQDTWIKEKLEMQEKIKSLENRLIRADTIGWQKEVDRLNHLIEEKNNLVEKHRREERFLKEDVEKLRRQNDDLRNKMSEPERLRGPGRGYSSDTKELQEMKSSLMQAEIEELRTKLHQEEKVHRSEMAALKMMNDVKLAQMQDDIQMLHIQIGKFKRERDTYKEMLDGAQRTIGDLKSDTLRRKSSIGNQEVEESRLKLQTLRKAMDELQDQLESREKAHSHLKTEYMTEKASWEIKMLELQSKCNELEESTILQGGKSRIFGVKTKLELAWQKEREEQQRLLTESHKMAKELRQRVVDLENSRDTEQQEGKRQLEELRRTVESDQAETQIKISELQTDLLELRDAHAKMRTTNDRIKREKEKLEREREEIRMKLSEILAFQSDDAVRISAMMEEMERMRQMLPSAMGEAPPKNPKGPDISRIRTDFKESLQKIIQTTEELRRVHSTSAREEDRVRRNPSFRKALSTASESDSETYTKPPLPRGKDDPLSRWQNPQKVTNYPASPPSMVISPGVRRHPTSALHRKSLSLDQSLTMEQFEKGIWKGEDDAGSSSSLQDPRAFRSSGGADYIPSGSEVPSPMPRRKKKLGSNSSLDSATSSREASVEKEQLLRVGAHLRTVSPAPSSSSRHSSGGSPKLPPKMSKEGLRRPPSGAGSTSSLTSVGSLTTTRHRPMLKARSIEEEPSSHQEILKPSLSSSASRSTTGLSESERQAAKDFKAKISNIFKKPPPPVRTSSVDRDELAAAASASVSASSSSRTLKPPVGDPRQRIQYRSTGALHTQPKTVIGSDGSEQQQTSASLPRRILRKFAIKSKSIDETSSSASNNVNNVPKDKKHPQQEQQRPPYTETPV